MNYGRFFEFDFESSYLQKGMAVFNYRWLQWQDEDANASGKMTPRYPVYLTMTPESIAVNLHYYARENKMDDGRHYHNTIVEIRLSSDIDVTDGLTESLNDIYEAQFPMNSNLVLREKIENSFEAQDCPTDAYSSFPCFKPNDKKSYVNMPNPQENQKTYFLRKIILDFLFDLEFSDVFKNVAFYDELAVKLRKNYIFNALMNKTKYYYYRVILSEKEVVDCCINDKGEVVDKKLIHFFEQYSKAEHEWVYSILDRRAMKCFHESPWFDESYQELEQVYYADREDSWEKSSDQKEGNETTDCKVECIKKDEQRTSNNKDVINEKSNDSKRIKCLKDIGICEDVFKLTNSNLLKLIRKKSRLKELIAEERKMADNRKKNIPEDSYHKAVYMHSETAKEAARWEVGHYRFLGLLKLWFCEKKTMRISAAIVIILVIIGGWLGYWLYENYDNAWPCIGVVVGFVVLLYLSGRCIRLSYRSTWGNGGAALMMPRLLAAVVTAWFTMAMSEDLAHYFAGRGKVAWDVVFILLLTTFMFVMYESRSLNPYDKTRNQLLHSLIVIFIAYVYSFIVGLMVFGFFSKPIVAAINEQMCDSAAPIELHPGAFIVQFSFFATFIGIFLQLMLQGKSVTETN